MRIYFLSLMLCDNDQEKVCVFPQRHGKVMLSSTGRYLSWSTETDQYSPSLFVNNPWLPYSPQITWLLSSIDQAPRCPRNHLNDSVNTYRRGCLHSNVWPWSPATGSRHIQGKHPPWHFWELRVFFPTWWKAISHSNPRTSFPDCLSTKYQVMYVSLRSFVLQTFDSRVLCKVCLPPSAVLGHAILVGEECPSVTGERLISGEGNGQLAGTEELHPRLSGQELFL